MFNRKLKKDIDDIKSEIKRLDNIFYKLEIRHVMILQHLNLTERRIVEHFVIEKKGGPEKDD